MLTLVERVLLLAEVPVFAGTRTADLAHLAAVARETEAARGDLIQRAGESPDALHVVIEGRVRLQRDDQAQEVTSGAFGAWSLFDQQPRAFTATAVESTRLLSIDRDAFVDVISDHVNVARGVLRVLAGRLRKQVQEGGDDALARSIEIG